MSESTIATPSSRSESKAPGLQRLSLTRVRAHPATRELLILLGFVLVTSVMTWPWVTQISNAVADPGDPYTISYLLWWDYHQTFNDPLNLFHATIFYPLPYTLAFTENAYGIALLFFPLFALGFPPLTINSLATFLGFAFCGYGAFRLTRTLTDSNVAAWIAGLIFAFLPYRFHLLSHLHYLFSGWIPITLEALVLFARDRSYKRAAWLAIAFTLNTLSCVTWFILSLTPLALTTVYLVIRYQLMRDRAFWQRGATAMVASGLVLVPFLLPFHYASQANGFAWSRDVVEKGSASPLNYLMAEDRNQLWKGFGRSFMKTSENNYRLFPGLLPILLALAGVLIPEGIRKRFRSGNDESSSESNLAPVASRIRLLDALAVLAGAVAFVSLGWAGSKSHPLLGQFFTIVTSDRALVILVFAVLLRFSVSYPFFVRRASGANNLIDNIRFSRNGEALWIGGIWAVTGFLMSLGTNSWLYRMLYDLLFFFRAMREPSRAAMIASLGVAMLAGLGASKLFLLATRDRQRRAVYACIVLATICVLFELRAAPLRLVRGEAYPDELTVRLKKTPMRGGLVELPTGGGTLPHLYVLRAADHGKPLINAISTFVPQHSYEIASASLESPIPSRLLDAIERVPTSYLVVHNSLIESGRQPAYKTFLIQALSTGRLRFIRRYGEGDDLYAVVKTEPEAQSEGPLPFGITPLREWSAMLDEDPVNLLFPADRVGELYRVHLVATGKMPRYKEFLRDAKTVGRNVYPGLEDELSQFQNALRTLAVKMLETPEMKQRYDHIDDARYVDQLLQNAGMQFGETDREKLIQDIRAGRETRAGALLRIVYDSSLARKEHDASQVLLHFFAYLRRNPDDPPDGNMNGFLHWLKEVKKHGTSHLGTAFASSIEHQAFSKPRLWQAGSL